MSKFAEYTDYDAIGLAELVKKKEVSPAELCDAAAERIETLNPRINAVVYEMIDSAKEAACHAVSDAPFAGVPFLLKDILIDYAGVPTTSGSKALETYIPDMDSEIVIRYKKAGFNIIGKTNCPEFGLLAVTEPTFHGPTRNPWNPGHTPGGSSGGSAAAVAAGMVPAASASDGGGSIRIPAAHCGLFGLKPSRGRTPNGPRFGEIWKGMVVEHVLTRSVRDSAAILDVVQGADIGAPYIIAPPQRPYMEDIQTPPGKLKIAFSTQSPIGTPVHPECEKAIYKTAKLLLQLGHEVEQDAPEIDGQSVAECFFMLYFAEVAAQIQEIESVLGEKPNPKDLELLTRTLGLLGKSYSAGDFAASMKKWNTFGRSVGIFHQTYDLYLTPTTAFPPARVGELAPKPIETSLLKAVNAFGLGSLLKRSGIMDKLAVESFSKTPFTMLANFTGQPAMSVPVHWTPDGLPIGAQFSAPFGAESILLKMAAQLEQAQPWFAKRPPIASESKRFAAEVYTTKGESPDIYSQ